MKTRPAHAGLDTAPVSRWMASLAAPSLVLSAMALASCGPLHGTSEPPPSSSPARVTTSGPPGGEGHAVDDPWSTGTRAGTPASSSGPATSSPPSPSSSAGSLPRDAQLLLDAHNRYRARHCAPPLTWSPELAEYAQRWADALAHKGCAFAHSTGRYGENLAAGTTGAIDPERVVAMWYEEIAGYSFERPGFSMQTGHFTQVVWRGTQRLGCGMSQCKGMDIWVCEYDPPGNVQSRFGEHVQPATCQR